MASLPKQIKTIQDTQAKGSFTADASGTWMIMRTSLNAKCAHVIGIPHEALIEGESITLFLYIASRQVGGTSFFTSLRNVLILPIIVQTL